MRRCKWEPVTERVRDGKTSDEALGCARRRHVATSLQRTRQGLWPGVGGHDCGGPRDDLFQEVCPRTCNLSHIVRETAVEKHFFDQVDLLLCQDQKHHKADANEALLTEMSMAERLELETILLAAKRFHRTRFRY